MFKVILSGILIGIANIIPGVSGATLAVLTNQYNKIMTVCSNCISFKIKQVDWIYLFVIIGAAIGGIYLFSWPLDHSLTNYQSYTLLIIVGLIIGSIKGVRLTKKERTIKEQYLNPFCVMGVCIIGLLIVLPTDELSAANTSAVMYLVSGAVAMIAMIIPGVSGSMILIILGTYADIIRSIKEQQIMALVPFVLGVLIGGVIGVKTVKWVMDKYANQFESFVIGAIVGSIIYIGLKINIVEVNILIAILLVAVSSIVAKWLINYGRR